MGGGDVGDAMEGLGDGLEGTLEDVDLEGIMEGALTLE